MASIALVAEILHGGRSLQWRGLHGGCFGVSRGVTMGMQYCVRTSGPVSSVRAAEHVHRFAPSQCDRILSAIGRLTANRLGATAAEIGEACGLTVVQVARRLPELRRAGKTVVLQHACGDLMRNGYRCWALVRE